MIEYILITTSNLYFLITYILLYFNYKNVYLLDFYIQYLFMTTLSCSVLCSLSIYVLFNIENVFALIFVTFFNQRGINFYIKRKKEKNNKLINIMKNFIFIEFFIHMFYIIYVNITFYKTNFNISEYPFYILFSFVLTQFLLGLTIIKINYKHRIMQQYLICLISTIPGFILHILNAHFFKIINIYYIKYSWIIFSSFLTHLSYTIFPLYLKNNKNILNISKEDNVKINHMEILENKEYNISDINQTYIKIYEKYLKNENLSLN